MYNALAFGMPGGWEWIIVLVIAVLIFGRRLPDIVGGVGRSLGEFKKGLKSIQDDSEVLGDTIEKEVKDAKDSVTKDL